MCIRFRRRAPGYCLCTTHIAQYAIVVGLAECGHAAKTLEAREGYDDFITFLGTPRKLDHVWRLVLFIAFIPCVNAFKLDDKKMKITGCTIVL